MRDLLPFLKLIGRSYRWVLLGILCSVVTLLAGVGLMALSGWFLSAAAFAGLCTITAREFNFSPPSAGVRGLAIVRTGGRYLERIVSHDTTLRVLASLRVWFYRRLEPLAPAGLERHRSGDLLNRIVTDIDTLDSLTIRVLSPMLAAMVLAFVVGGFLWWIQPPLALVFWSMFLLAGLVVPWLASRMGRKMGLEMQRLLARLRESVVEDIQGMADLMIYQADLRHRQKLLAESEQLLDRQERMARISGFNAAMTTLLPSLSAVAALYVAIPLVQDGVVDGSMLAVIAFGTLAAFEAILPLPMAFQFLGKTREAARRLVEVVEQPAAVTFVEQSAPVPTAFGVFVDRVSFAYPGGCEALKDIDLQIPQHARVALVGPSGSGKSTLADLLVRFRDPQQGQIRIGDTELSCFNEQQLREMVTLVSQKSHVFCATLRDNLLLGDPEATEGQLWEALEEAHLAEFVKSLPRGLDTWTGEEGSHLSGGQARRLVLARALLRRSPIWVLDEPTEGLDNRTRQQVMRTLFDGIRGKTMLVITHTTDGLEQMDRVYFMTNARIVGHGRHEDLLRDCASYRDFVGLGGSGFLNKPNFA